MPMKSAKRNDSETPPDVERHDEVYFRHPSGPKCGKVLSRGQHGCVIEADGKRHKVKWEHLHGHKVRVRPDVKVVDTGEDGFIVADGSGRRRFVQDPLGVMPNEEEAMGKSVLFVSRPVAAPTVLFFCSGEDLAKAAGGGGPIKGRPGLTLQRTTDKSGKPTQRWMRNQKEEPKGDRGKKSSGADKGYGTHNLSEGSHVSFKGPDGAGEGTIASKPGKDGAYVKDATGKVHEVPWVAVTGHKPAPKKPPAAPTVLSDQKPLPSSKFSAADYAKRHNDPNASHESTMAHFPPDAADKVKETQERLKGIEETIAKHKAENGKGYNRSRQKLHRAIYNHFMSPEKIAAATPAPDEDPTFTVLGGRGGSGKSALEHVAYDPNKAIVLDADEVKKLLPEYEGWNAHQVHEESSDILKDIMTAARNQGLNIVLDATMKSGDKAVAQVKEFKDDGYRIEAHYMHLPRQEAAKRGVDRFLGETNRYVPTDVILGNKENEANFDRVRQHADKWSFRDNNVPYKTPPLLISHSDDGG
jgi:predicted ABC-type ATPase